jgi:hypothetical protein
MDRIRFVHWNKAEAKAKAENIQAFGYDVDCEPFDGPPTLRKMREHPPAAVVIDLSKSPSRGRDVGVALWHYASTRHVPLVFVEGDAQKVERIKELLPDAVYTTWNRIRGSLKRAIADPPKDPVRPKSLLEGYAGTPLPKKLGIKTDTVVALVSSPKEFERTLGPLPKGVTLRKQARGQNDLIVWFTISRRDLEGQIKSIVDVLKEKGGLWIAWPKRASGGASDLTQNLVRQVGLASGLVDYKVCAIDAMWSGLLFTRRKKKKM